MTRVLAVTSLLLFAATASAGVVQPLGAHYQMLIPAAGNAQGANGTFFRSDITILNLSARNQTVRLEWLSQNGTSNSVRTIEIAASSGIRSADFVGEIIGASGLGSIVMTALTSPTGGVVDTTARLYVNSRIWSPQPGTGGTTSQSFPAIPLQTINTPSAALFAVGGGPAPDNPADYRVNIGIVNLDATNSQSFSIYIPVPTLPIPVNVTLPPRSMIQVPMGGDHSPTTQYIVQNTTATATRSNNWIAYQSNVNNITGDAWSEPAVAGTP
jgi:hypothetical protein